MKNVYNFSDRNHRLLIVKEVRAMLKESLGLDFTSEQVEAFVTNEDRVRSEIERWGVCDTEVASCISDAIAQKLINRSVPTYGEARSQNGVSDEDYMNKFWSELHAAARNRGYKTA